MNYDGYMALTRKDLTDISKIVQTNIQTETRKIINGQSAMKSELLDKIDKLDKKLTGRIDGVEERLTKKIDKLGLQIANLEDDTLTIEEFDKLERRVSKVEHSIASV